MTVQQLLRAARQQLAQAVPADEANIEAQMLLMQVLTVNRAWLLAHAMDTLTAADEQRFQSLLQRRLRGEPVAHILGYREFFGLSLRVTADTLIPRPDTETLVEAALDKISQQSCDVPWQVLDLGTGTGAIALAIARHAPRCMVTAAEASPAALAVAQGNAAALQMQTVRMVLSDWFSALAGQRYHVIVTNPPYIEAADPHLQLGDLRFEPLRALASGADGLQDIRVIVQAAPAHLYAGGWLMLEHGYDQAVPVQQLLNASGFQAVKTLYDLGGQPRVTIGQWRTVSPV